MSSNGVSLLEITDGSRDVSYYITKYYLNIQEIKFYRITRYCFTGNSYFRYYS